MRDVFPSATIVRPSDVYGFEDRFLRYYASLRIFPFGLIPMLKGSMDVMKSPVYVSTASVRVGICECMCSCSYMWQSQVENIPL